MTASDKTATPDRTSPECGFRASVVAICALLASGLTIGQLTYSFGLFVGPLAEEFPTWTRVQINVALSVGQVVSALASPLMGGILDRFGVRRVVPLSCFTIAGGWLLVRQTMSLAVLYAGFGLVYLGYPANVFQQAGKVVGAWFPRNRGKMMGIITAGNNLGGAVMAQIAAALEWRDVALTFAALQAASAVLYLVVVRDSRPEAVTSTPAKATATKTTASGIGSAPLRSGRFVAVSLALCCCYYTYVSVLTQLPPALRADGLAVEAAATCLSLAGVLGIASKILAGLLADRIGAKRTMQLSLLLQEAALALLMVHGWLPADRRPEVLAWLASALYGLGFGAVGAMIPLIVLEEYGVQLLGRAQGLVSLTFLGPSLVAPAVAGVVFDATGQYTGSFAGTAGVFVVALAVLEGLQRMSIASAPAEDSVAVGTQKV